jgi:SAM-dependent methyltransferase
MARLYRALEFAAFGRDLERARFAHLGRLADCRDILLLGEGDGRCALGLATMATGARLLCVDSSPGMIRRARARLDRAGVGTRVAFECADLRSYTPPPGAFDAVATLFVLDCFGTPDVASIISRTGAARLRARAWIALLYAFFRWETGLGVSVLPPSEDLLREAGWRITATRTLQFGLLRSTLYEHAAAY